MKHVSLYNLTLLAILAIFLFVLSVTVLNGLHYDYSIFADDPGYVKTYQNFGLLDGISFLYHHNNGRLVSHTLSLFLCPLIAQGPKAIILIYLINVLLFTSSLALFLRSFFVFRYGAILSGWRSFLLSILIYSIFFLLHFEKRFEWWFWLSSVTVYQYSLILLLGINGILLVKREYNRLEILLVAMCFIAIGFMSEIQAGVEILLIVAMILSPYLNKSQSPSHRIWFKISAIALIAIPLLINYLSSGNARKLRISQTDFSNFSSITKSIGIVGNDLACRWDPIIIHSAYLIKLNAIGVKLICVCVLIISLVLLMRQWRPTLASSQIILPKHLNMFSVFFFSLFIYIISLAIPAFLYSNFVSTIFDRCKLIGSFMVMFSLVDLILIATFHRYCFDVGHSEGKCATFR